MPTTYLGEFIRTSERNDGGPSAKLVSYTSYTYDEDLKQGVDNPRWKDQVRRLQEAGTDYVRQSTRVFPRPEFTRLREIYPTVVVTKVATGMRWRSASHGKGIPVPVSSADDSRAKGKFLSNASEALSPFRALPFLGELRETLGLIKGRSLNLFELITSYVRTARRIRRRFSSPSKSLKSIRDLYLEAQFGWKPILNDVENAVLALKRVENDVKLWTATGKASTTSQVVFPPVSAPSTYGCFVGRYKRVNSSSVKYTGQVKVTVSREGGSPDALLEACGFRLAEFVPALWELLPWSWAMDYFSNAGDLVNAAFFDKSKLVWCCKTQFNTSEQTSSWDFDYGRTVADNPATAEATSTGGEFRTNHLEFRRNVADPGVPDLVLELPLSGWKIANLLAALTTLRNQSGR